MNNPATLGCVNGSVIESHFLASLKWRTYAALTRIGAFNASANVDIMFFNPCSVVTEILLP